MARATVLPTLLLLFLLLPMFSAGAVRDIVDLIKPSKRSCSAKSESFSGICIWEENCRTICETEGFTSGYCRRLLRTCVCTKECP